MNADIRPIRTPAEQAILASLGTVPEGGDRLADLRRAAARAGPGRARAQPQGSAQRGRRFRSPPERLRSACRALSRAAAACLSDPPARRVFSWAVGRGGRITRLGGGERLLARISGPFFGVFPVNS
ncbi:MAG: hypothetical protein E2602_15815 [Achromobacter sp.]|nr:hypothetical protein [Achromobacter sp.]